MSLIRGNHNAFEDIVDLIIILIVLEFLCECVFNNRNC
jgi:hypothetical protein